MEKILIIIPTYNESENIKELVLRVPKFAPAMDILFVDDNSPDGTGKEANKRKIRNPKIHVLDRPFKQGLGRAYIAGFKWALEHDYDLIFEMDADFSHGPEWIPIFIYKAQQADLVLGSRYVGGIRVLNWPIGRLVISILAGVYVRMVTGMPFTDPTGGFKCYRRAVLENIDLDSITSNGYSFQIEMTHRAWTKGFRILEVPITFDDRRGGKSKLGSGIVREAVLMVWKLLFRNKLRRTAPKSLHPKSVLAVGAKA
jgi:dolichol-phosphate mannosyltransferase